MALTKTEIRRLEKAKAWWRPLLGYAGALCLVMVTFTVCFAVLSQIAQLSDAISFFVSLPPSIATLLGIQSAGRSYEKAHDNAHYSVDDMYSDAVEPDPDTGVYIDPQSPTPPTQGGI